jgi:hypothetical protein
LDSVLMIDADLLAIAFAAVFAGWVFAGYVLK